MRKFLYTSLALIPLIPGIARAQVTSALPSVERTFWNPPARFDHPYHGRLIIKRIPQDRIVKACSALLSPLGIPAHMNQRGCSYEINKHCTVYIINRPYHGTTPQAVLRHEIGHCNGWNASHSN